MAFEMKLKGDGFSQTDELDGRNVRLLSVDNPKKEPITGEILQAWLDLNGVVQYVQIMKEDGMITWEEVSKLFIIVLDKVTEKRVRGIQRFFLFVKGLFKRKSKRKKHG